jgi:hypothetical protein
MSRGRIADELDDEARLGCQRVRSAPGDVIGSLGGNEETADGEVSFALEDHRVDAGESPEYEFGGLAGSVAEHVDPQTRGAERDQELGVDAIGW